MSFDEIFDLTAGGVYFNFYNNAADDAAETLLFLHSFLSLRLDFWSLENFRIISWHFRFRYYCCRKSNWLRRSHITRGKAERKQTNATTRIHGELKYRSILYGVVTTVAVVLTLTRIINASVSGHRVTGQAPFTLESGVEGIVAGRPARWSIRLSSSLVYVSFVSSNPPECIRV